MGIDKLTSILNSEPEERTEEKNLFSKVYISRDAFTKARMYASFARAKDGRHVECYGYLLGDGEKRSRLVDDVYFVSNQSAGDAHVMIPAESVIRAGHEIMEQGKRVLGWWHSHARMQTFHSGTDDANLKTVLNQIAPSNFIRTYSELDFLTADIKKTKDGDSTVIVCDRNNTSKRLEMIFSELDGNPLAGAMIEKLRVRIPMRIAYAYSIVVNGIGGPPYSEIATRKFCPVCHRDEYNAAKRPLAFVDCPIRLDLDWKKLKSEVESKLIVPDTSMVWMNKVGNVLRNEGSKRKKRRWWKK